jgi:WD40 repeat protein
MDRYPLWWMAGAVAAVAGAGLVVWRAQAGYERGSAELVPAVQPLEPWVVDRPVEVNQIVAALRHTETVGITIGVQGAGGFGKTTIAKMVRSDRRVLRQFRNRVYWVAVGRDTVGDALALLVNGLIARIEPERALTAIDTAQAAQQLAAVLAAGPSRLLILDDVWTDEQVAAFPLGGRSALLVTTRDPSLAAGTVMVPVRVNQMSDAQARALLQAGLPPLRRRVGAGLLAETGRWPLLLRLVNKILASQARVYPDITGPAEELLGVLRAAGALLVDELTGAAAQQLNVADPVQRSKAVRATIQASTSLLSPADRDRLAELAVFARNETIPVPLITALWQTSGLNQVVARALCARLANLALLALLPDSGAVIIHDVIRDYLREQLGTTGLARLHQMLLDTAAEDLPTAEASAGPGLVTAWWELPEDAHYWREHLIEHMMATGHSRKAELTAADLRWVDARLRTAGPVGPYRDLALVHTPRAERLRRVLGQAAHLLARTDPPHSLTDILCSRVSHDPYWAPQAKTLATTRTVPALANVWPLPDLPSPALRRTLTGHTGAVRQVAVAPDGSWLATASRDHTARIWDAATGQQRAVLASHSGPVIAAVIAPDSSWLATAASGDKTARVWDAATGQQRAVLVGHAGRVWAMAAAPDSSWLATAASGDKTARVWDAATGQQRAVLVGHANWVDAVAVPPDGSWLATASEDGTVRVWDAVTWRQRVVLDGHTGPVRAAVVIAPDSSWLAAASGDGTVRVWDAVTWRQRAVLANHAWGGDAMVIAPDGSWLATAGKDHMVRVWDAVTWRQRAVLDSHSRTPRALALAVSPDGTWLATAGDELVVRIWDAVTWRQRAVLDGHTRPAWALAVSPDGTWLATSSEDKTVRIWDPATAQSEVSRAADSRNFMYDVKFSPDNSWLATTSWDGSVRIWDAVTGQQRGVLTGYNAQARAVAVAPDGTWLATTSSGGRVLIWDAATGHQRVILAGYTSTSAVTGVTVAPDGTWLATSSRDGSVRIWDAATAQQRAVLDGHTSRVRVAAVAPDGAWLATIDGETVQIWDLAAGQRRVVLDGHIRQVRVAAVAPDGAWLVAAGDDEMVRIWDTVTGQQRVVLDGRIRWVRAVAVAPDGTWLAASGDEMVRIWDAVTGQQVALLDGHTGSPVVAIAPDGTWLATTSREGTVRIWDPATGCISALMRVESQLEGCTWSPSGDLLAVAGDAIYLFAFKPKLHRRFARKANMSC